MDQIFYDTFQKLHESKLVGCSEMLLLALTNQRKDGWVIVDLVEMSGLSPSTIGMAKARMIESGLIEEHLPHRDLRTVKVYLTDSGHEKAAKLWEAVRDLAGIESSYRSSDPPVRKCS